MGESSACLMRSFSQPSPTSQDSLEGDPLSHALTASVSFGRFMSESLAWEKWSSFTQNRYLEEVEKYSKPGSVAEKKAYFEAHYNRKAAQKAAASLELENAAVNDIPASSLTNMDDNHSPIQMAQGQEVCHVPIEEGQDEEDPTSNLNLSVDRCGQSPLKGYKIESDQIEETKQGIEQPIFVEKLVESSILPEYGQFPLKECRIESDQIEGTDQEIEQHPFVENQVESSILPEYGQSPLRECGLENEQIYRTEWEIEHPTFVQNQVESSTLLEDAQYIIDQQEVKAPTQDAATMEVSAFSDKKKCASSSAKLSGHRQESRLRPPLKSATPIQPKNGGEATSYGTRTEREFVEKKRSTPKSLHMSISFGSRIGDTNRTSSPEPQKTVNSRLVRNLGRTTRESAKQQTPTRASTYGISKHISLTPPPAIARTKKVPNHPISESITRDGKPESLHIRTKKLPNHPISESITRDGKPESLHIRSSISSTKCRMKAKYPSVPASFNLRTEERAAKRKEKLQQKLSMEAMEKEQLQERLKGKIRNDAKDVRQSIVSQGKAIASFHLGMMKPLDVQIKKTTGKPCSPGSERKQESEVLQNNSRPTWRHSVKAGSFKDLLDYKHLPPTYPTKMFPHKNNMNENTCPNIRV